MAEHEIATALELMQGGLKFESYNESGYKAPLWKWRFGNDVRRGFKTQLDAVNGFCEWYSQIRTVKDAPQPAAFDVDAFMMDGIRALALAAAEEVKARDGVFYAQSIAGELAFAWHNCASMYWINDNHR